MNQTNKELQEFKKNLKKKGYVEMVKQMCTVDKSKLTRIITLHIAQDYSVFTEGKLLYQYSFSSKLILRWTCYSLNEEGCMDKTFSIVCRYLLKNHPAKNVTTKRHPDWPLPGRRRNSTEATIPSFEPRQTIVFTTNTANKRYERQYFPNVKYVYSSGHKPLLAAWLQRIGLLISLVLLVKHRKFVIASL